MRKVINCAITLALLVIGAAAQATTPPPMPTVLVAGEEVSVPEQGVIRMLVADLSVDIPVAQQWENSGAMYTYAFNFRANAFSEEWRTKNSVIFQRAVAGGNSTTFSKGKCVKGLDTTVWVSAVKSIFDSLTVSEGLVYDPFVWRNTDQLALMRDQAGRNWIWLNPVTGKAVYAQQWIPSEKKNLVYMIMQEQVMYDSSSYDFRAWKCAV